MMKCSLPRRSSALLLVALGSFAFTGMQAQSNAVTTAQSGSKVFLEINAQQLRSELDALMSGLSSSGSGNWNTILTNGSNPGMDVDFSGYDAKGIEDLIATGTVTADSLVLNKDANVTGRMTITEVTTVNDSLKALGYVTFSDSLEVVRAVSIGEALFVTGVTSLGDSLHVVGTVDLEAMLNVDGAVTFGASLAVDGVTTLNDSLKVNGDAAITGTLSLDSLSVTDVINGQVNSLENFTSDALLEGDSNLYFTAAERTLLASLSGVLNTLDSLIAVIDGLGGATSDAWNCGSPVSYQGYDYATVEIGSQCWFAENVRSTSYNDDVEIPSELDNAAWTSTTEGAVTVYNEGAADGAANLTTYGRLYNWHAVNTGKLCPSGWHVPSNEDWSTLTGHLGSDAGTRMKASASDSPAWDGTNSSGFSALPGGFRDTGNGFFFNQGADGYWWTSSLDGPNASLIYLTTGNPNFGLASTNQGTGFSVRCAQDAAASAAVPTVLTEAASDVAEEAASLNGSITSDGGEVVTASGFRWGALADLSDAQDLVGSGTCGAFTSNLTGLTAGTTYYFTAFAMNAGGTAYGDTLSFETAASSLFTCGTSAVTFSGHDYATVEIGSQCWFAENLRSTSYNDGEMIPDDASNEEWTNTTHGATALYDGSEINGAIFGRLYNWYAVNTSKLCPAGWQVPDDAQWTALTDQLGGESVAGELMKASASDDPSWNGSNSSGFSGLPGGLRDGIGPYYQLNTFGYWWSRSSDADSTWYRRLGSTSDGVHRAIADSPQLGLSVRCIQGTSGR